MVIRRRGSIQKIEFEPLIRTVYLRRNDALLSELEWDWSDKQDDRFIFPTFEAAEQKALELISAGEAHIHAVVVGELEEQLQRERNHRHLSIEAAMVAGADPEPLPTAGRQQKPLAERVAIAKRGARTRMASTRAITSESDALARWEAQQDGD